MVNMLQRVGMDDKVERGVAVWQAMKVYVWIGGEEMPLETMKEVA